MSVCVIFWLCRLLELEYFRCATQCRPVAHLWGNTSVCCSSKSCVLLFICTNVGSDSGWSLPAQSLAWKAKHAHALVSIFAVVSSDGGESFHMKGPVW